MNTSVVLLLLQLAAFWPVWQWYAKRMTAGNADDQWCLLAAVTAMACLLMERVRPHPAGKPLTENTLTMQSNPPRSDCPQDAGAPHAWLIPAALMMLYAATFHWLPPMLRAVIAVIAVGFTASQILLRKSLPPALAGLLLLALPTIPLLQFYLGYPLRVLVGAVTAPLLQLAGLSVIREGTALNWSGQTIAIDAPCSGIKMLWAGLFLLFAVAWLHRLSAVKTVVATLLAMVVIVAGNILRASALFYLEAEIFRLPSFIDPNVAHNGVGIVTFVFTAIGIVASVRWLQRFRFVKPVSLCDTPPLSSSPVS